MTVKFDSVGRGRADSLLLGLDARKHKLLPQINALNIHVYNMGHPPGHPLFPAEGTDVGPWRDETLQHPSFAGINAIYDKMKDLTDRILDGFVRVGLRMRLGVMAMQLPGGISTVGKPFGREFPKGTVVHQVQWSNRVGNNLVEWPQIAYDVQTSLSEWITAFEAIKVGFPFGYNINSAAFFHFGMTRPYFFDSNVALYFSTTLDVGPMDSYLPPWDYSASALSKFLGADVGDLRADLASGTPLVGGGYLPDTYGDMHIVQSSGDDIADAGRQQDEWNLRVSAACGTWASPSCFDYFWIWSQQWNRLRFNMNIVADAYLPPPQNLVATPTGTPGEVQLDFESGLYTEVNHSVVINPFAVIHSDDLLEMNHAQAVKVIGFQTGDTITGLASGVTRYFAVISLSATFLVDTVPVSVIPTYLGNFTSGVSFSNGPLSNIDSAIPL